MTDYYLKIFKKSLELNQNLKLQDYKKEIYYYLTNKEKTTRQKKEKLKKELNDDIILKSLINFNYEFVITTQKAMSYDFYVDIEQYDLSKSNDIGYFVDRFILNETIIHVYINNIPHEMSMNYKNFILLSKYGKNKLIENDMMNYLLLLI